MSALEIKNLELNICNEWHILKSETQYGPYTYQEMIGMGQNGLVFDFDFIWAPHLQAWTPLAEVPEFSKERLALLAQQNQSQQQGFNRREHERVSCQLPVYVNDQSTLWEGEVENLSEGGALVLMKNPVLLPGNIINLHFRSMKSEEKPFNCTAQILNKRLVKARIKHNTGVHYAVKFMAKSNEAEGQINIWLKNFRKKY